MIKNKYLVKFINQKIKQEIKRFINNKLKKKQKKNKTLLGKGLGFNDRKRIIKN